MDFKNYLKEIKPTQTVIFSEDLRDEIRRLRVAAREITANYENEDRSGKIAITKAKKAIENQIKKKEELLHTTCHPAVRNPKQRLENVIERINRIINKENKLKAEMIAALEKNAKYAIERYAEDMYVAAEIAGYYKRIMNMFDKEEQTISNLFELLKHSQEKVERNLLQGTTHSFDRDYKHLCFKAYREMVADWGDNSIPRIIDEIKYWHDHIVAWGKLQAELEQ